MSVSPPLAPGLGGQQPRGCFVKFARGILPAQSCPLAYWVTGVSAAAVMAPDVSRCVSGPG